VLAQIRKARHQDNGFTLIELLLVIVIIGVLASIVVFSVGGINDTSKEAACKADIKTVMTASEAYYAQEGSYTNVAGLVTADLLKSAPDTVAISAAGVVTGANGADRDCTGVTV
jgi:prepilin-type N-terminal cleavage/methylation domain-containing protein